MAAKLLLVDDDEDDRDFFREAIHAIDPALHCDFAGNGKAALDRLLGGDYIPDLIFLDMNMPVMGGKQFLVEVKQFQHLSEIPVVVLSTSADPVAIAEAKNLGATDFVTKPNKISILEDALRSILENFSKG